MPYAKGAKRDSAEYLASKKSALDHPKIAPLLASATPLPQSIDLGPYCPPIFNQNLCGSCTAHSKSGLIVTACAAAGKPIPIIPSPRRLYIATRDRARSAATLPGDTLPDLTDSGATGEDVLNALALDGVAPMTDAPIDGYWTDCVPANVNDETGQFEALEESATRIITGESIISTTNLTIDQISDACAAALATKIPLWVLFFCDTAFENLAPGAAAQAPNQDDPNGGGHAVYLKGYTGSTGSRRFRIRNSWGVEWADQGEGDGSEAWLQAAWAIYLGDVAHISSTARAA
jgi:hypothetical protein